MSSTLQPLDLAILAVYFVVVTFLGVVVGRKKTNTLADFFIARGRWGPMVAFVFVFASAVGGAEAVVVAGGAYRSGLSGVWYWLAGIFGVIVYYLFSTIYKRSRVFNLADFFGMRFGRNVATFYAVYGTLLLLFQVGVFALGGGKSISGLSGLSVDQSVLVASLVVALYLGSGGLMSSLLTDIFQGILALTAFCFLPLPFLWEAAGGFDALRQLPPEVWSLHSAELPLSYVTALIFSGTFGAIASPFLFSLLVVGKDERAATQCAWGHLWKRTITILFAMYGILFALYKPGLSDPEQAWGLVMKEILPAGLLGLLIASFFGALMSTVDTLAASSSALVVDHILKARILPSRSPRFYMRCARIWGFFVVFFSYLIARQFDSIKEFIEFLGPLVLLMSVPLFFGVVWRKANRQGTWAGLASGGTALSRLPLPGHPGRRAVSIGSASLSGRGLGRPCIRLPDLHPHAGLCVDLLSGKPSHPGGVANPFEPFLLRHEHSHRSGSQTECGWDSFAGHGRAPGRAPGGSQRRSSGATLSILCVLQSAGKE